jgi:hypothetical protein
MSIDYQTVVQENYKSNPGIVEKRKKTNLEKYGVEHAPQSQEVLNKMYETNIEKYGYKTVLADPYHTQKTSEYVSLHKDEINEKRKATNLEKYGVEHYLQTDEFINRRSEKWLSVYGTTNMFDATHPKTKRYKDIIYQSSYEKYFLELCEINNILQFVSRPDSIMYTFNGKSYRYYPDYKLFDVIIEIKSKYTYNKIGMDIQLQQLNDAKFTAVKQNNEFQLLLGKQEIYQYINSIKK